jgi:hypothetical protein
MYPCFKHRAQPDDQGPLIYFICTSLSTMRIAPFRMHTALHKFTTEE